MKAKSLFSYLILSYLILFSEAMSFSCSPNTTKELYDKADAVILAKISNVTPQYRSPSQKRGDFIGEKVFFDTAKLYKGAAYKEAIHSYIPDYTGEAYKPGYYYILFLYKDAKGIVRTGLCTGSREIGINIEYMQEIESISKNGSK